jgi:hypothetical protein
MATLFLVARADDRFESGTGRSTSLDSVSVEGAGRGKPLGAVPTHQSAGEWNLLKKSL